MFTKKFIASFAFKWWVRELLAHYTSYFFYHFFLKLILNFWQFNIKLWNWFRSHYLLHSLIWNHKILESQKSFVDWEIWLSNKFLLNGFLNNVRNWLWSESCVSTNWDFFNMRLSWNIRSINLRSLSRSKHLCKSWISILRSLSSHGTWLMRLNNWISINSSKIVNNWRSVPSIIASILWYVSNIRILRSVWSVLISCSTSTTWRWNLLMIHLIWISWFIS